MKHSLIWLIIIFGFTTSIGQNISENAIGLRLGDSDGFGAEISYQRALTEQNRLEVDLGIRSGNDFDGFKLAGIYQWIWNIDGGFNWYAGAGGGLGNYSYDLPKPFKDDSETFLFAAGNVGIEYHFDIPLMLSLDARPEFGFGDFNDDLDLDIALSVRYKF